MERAQVDHRQPRRQGAVRRRRLGQGEPRRRRSSSSTGMTPPEYREGDTTFSGRDIADVVESGKMEVRAKIDETDRDNLQSGQTATVECDALPGENVQREGRRAQRPGARAATSSRRARCGSSTSPSPSISPDPRLKAGSSLRVVIDGREIAYALHVPRQAVFEKNGKNFVFLQIGDRFDRRDVKVVNRTESRAVIAGLNEGDVIALIDPDVAAQRGSRRAGPLPTASGRGEMSARASPLVAPTSCPSSARPREPPRAQAALAADDARDDLRRGGGRRDAVDRRRRAAGSDGVHRAARRSQPDRRGARGRRQPGAAEGAQAVVRAVVPGPAHHPDQPRRDHARRARASGSRRRS